MNFPLQGALEEMLERVHFKPCPPYTAGNVKVCSSLKTYIFPSLQDTPQKRPWENYAKLIRYHLIVLTVEEIYRRKWSQYQAGSYVGVS